MPQDVYEDNNYIVTHSKTGRGLYICAICEKLNKTSYVFFVSKLDRYEEYYDIRSVCESCAKTPKEALLKYKNGPASQPQTNPE